MTTNGAEWPKTSVLVVTYNQQEYVAECLDSILAQDIPNLEIVVADDASKDRTPDLLREYQARFPETIKLVLAEHNGGVTVNCNRALSVSTGEYIALMGGDDVFLPGKLKKQIAAMQARPDASMCVTAAEVFLSSTNETLYTDKCAPPGKSEYGAADIVSQDNCVLGSTAMIRRSCCPIGGFDERIPIISDYLFYVECAVNGPVIALDEVLWRYRRHSSNTMSGHYQDRADVPLLHQILEFKYPFLTPQINGARARFCYLRGLHFFNAGDMATARILLRQAAMYRRSWKTLTWRGIVAAPPVLREGVRQRWLRRLDVARTEKARF